MEWLIAYGVGLIASGLFFGVFDDTPDGKTAVAALVWPITLPIVAGMVIRALVAEARRAKP